MYVIIAGKEVNQGTVISKAEKGADDIKVLDDDHWYLVQTNDDHFKGICQQRCIDANDHMTAIGKDNINMDNLLTDVILLPHTLNVHTIFTTMAYPAGGVFNSYGFDSDTEYV